MMENENDKEIIDDEVVEVSSEDIPLPMNQAMIN